MYITWSQRWLVLTFVAVLICCNMHKYAGVYIAGICGEVLVLNLHELKCTVPQMYILEVVLTLL